MNLLEDEKIILMNLPTKYKWIARDKNGDLTLYENKPSKSIRSGYWTGDNYRDFDLYSHLFQEIRWENEEPNKIFDLIGD